MAVIADIRAKPLKSGWERRRVMIVRPPTERWGVTADLIQLTGGHRNLAFKTLGLGIGCDLVFKSTRRTPPAIRWLIEVQKIARQSGFVVPEQFEGHDGQLIQDGWTCETFVEGIPFSPKDVPTVRPLISDFHAATAYLPQRPGFLSSRALIKEFSGGDVDLRAMPTDLVARCRDAWQAVSDRKEAVIHGDLNPANMIRCPDGRAALIDWDECRRDLVLFDLAPLRNGDEYERRARLAWEVACSWLVEPDHAVEVATQL